MGLCDMDERRINELCTVAPVTKTCTGMFSGDDYCRGGSARFLPCWLCTGTQWLQESSLKSPFWITDLHYLWLWSFTVHEVPKGATLICGLMRHYRLALFSLHCSGK